MHQVPTFNRLSVHKYRSMAVYLDTDTAECTWVALNPSSSLAIPSVLVTPQKGREACLGRYHVTPRLGFLCAGGPDPEHPRSQSAPKHLGCVVWDPGGPWQFIQTLTLQGAPGSH